MQRIYYSSGSVVTGNEIATAVLGYAQALSRHARADVVHVPVVLSSGETGTASLLIGPASQIASIPEQSAAQELRDPAVVADLERRSLALAGGVPSTAMYAESMSFEDYE
jgi:hypothetical protein